ncbi:hypothetical protein [Campylobacter armoricus]|uniref:hypothetical protein n=1 Tax=Campylobacter armoricus TaxID=2505970 RepID=UPI001F356DCA|nr:hypothetical protein [Campylobacter armoricus]
MDISLAVRKCLCLYLLMVVLTFLLAFIPTYESIGCCMYNIFSACKNFQGKL